MTIARIRPPRTTSSIMVAVNKPCKSGLHFPGSCAWEDSSVMTRTRRIEAIMPTTRNGSATSAPSVKETRTVCRISITIRTSRIRSIVTTSESEAPRSIAACQSALAALNVPRKRHEREQEAEDEIGKHLDAQKGSGGQRPDPGCFPVRLRAIHAGSRFTSTGNRPFLNAKHDGSLTPRWPPGHRGTASVGGSQR